MRPSHHPALGWPGPAGPGGVGVAGEGVQDQDGVAGGRIELPPGLVGHRRPRGATTAFEREPGLGPTRAGELAAARVVARRARAPVRSVRRGHAPLAARNPASRSARMSSIDSRPTRGGPGRA